MAAMEQWQSGAKGLSRRAVLLSTVGVPALLGAPPKGTILPPDLTRYDDPSTEFQVVRLTSAAYSSHLPACPGRAISRHSQFAVVASDRTAEMQLHWLDLKSGQNRVLAPIGYPRAFTLSTDDRTIYFRDEHSLAALPLTGTPRVVRLWEPAPGAEPVSLCASEDGTSLWFAEKAGGTATLLKLRLLPKAKPEVVVKSAEIRQPIPNPRRALVLWLSSGDTLWLGEHDGANQRRVETPAGRVLQAAWNPDGQSVLYLHETADRVATLREQDVDSRADRLVAKTSQYACFARNADATVFAGASRSKAGPYVLLMLRVTRRELALCEHRSSEAAASGLAFSPDSRRLVFEGDKEGKPVVYSVKLDRLVEETES